MQALLNIVWILLTFGILYFAFPLVVKIIYRYKQTKKVKLQNYSCLTFDDGPNEEFTAIILKLLQKHKIKATFFILGKNAQNNPDLINQMKEYGHEIAEHGYNHKHAWIHDPLSYMIDLIKGRKSLKNRSISAEWFRPTYGKVNILSLIYMILGKRKWAFWTIDPQDYQANDADTIADFVCSKLSSSKGEIVLLHDARAGSDPKLNSVQVTIDALKMVIDCADKKNVQFKTLKEIL